MTSDAKIAVGTRLGTTQLIRNAVETLLSYKRKPFIEDYLAMEDMARNTSNKVLKELLPGALSGESPTLDLKLERLLGYLDLLQESGRQVAFLFELPEPSRQEMLSHLRDPDFVQERLHLCGFEGCYNQERFITVPGKPELAAVRYQDHERMSLKWIELRTWSKAIGTKKAPKFQTEYERSANFVQFDLRTGNSEILIQALPPRCAKDLWQELTEYRELTAHLLGFDPFEPTSLEPAFRHAFEEGHVDVTHWSVELDDGDRLERFGPPAKAEGLEALQQSYRGRNITYNEYFRSPERQSPKKTRIQVVLNPPAGSVEIRQPCLPKEHQAILRNIRNVPPILSDPDLRALAQERGMIAPHLLPIIDQRLAAGEKWIDGGRLVEEDHATAEEVTEAFEKIRARNPRRFDRIVRDVPEAHGKPVVVVLAVIPRGWLFNMLDTLGIRVFRRVARDVWNLLFTAVYLPLSYLASKQSLSLVGLEAGRDALGGLYVVLTAVVLISLWIKFVGTDSVREGGKLVTELFKATTAFFGKS